MLLFLLLVASDMEDDVGRRGRRSVAVIESSCLVVGIVDVVVDVDGFLDSLRAKLASDGRDNELVRLPKTFMLCDLGIPCPVLPF